MAPERATDVQLDRRLFRVGAAPRSVLLLLWPDGQSIQLSISISVSASDPKNGRCRSRSPLMVHKTTCPSPSPTKLGINPSPLPSPTKLGIIQTPSPTKLGIRCPFKSQVTVPDSQEPPLLPAQSPAASMASLGYHGSEVQLFVGTKFLAERFLCPA